MKKIILLTNIAFLSLSLLGCNKNDAPGCSDDDVKEIVLNLSTQELKNNLLALWTLKLMMSHPQEMNDVNTAVGQAGIELGFNPLKPATADELYAAYVQAKSKNKTVAEIVENIDKQAAELKISLSSIRTNKKDDEIKKSECAAEITISDNSSSNIGYTAQYTEDGKVHVEASGLKKAFISVEPKGELKNTEAAQSEPQQVAPTAPKSNQPASTNEVANTAQLEEKIKAAIEERGDGYDDVPSSVNCQKPTNKAEELICANKTLSLMAQLDDESYVYAYENATKTESNHQEIKDSDWITNIRNKCTDEKCLYQAFVAHTNESLGGMSPYEQQ